jgi:hypothetical protein
VRRNPDGRRHRQYTGITRGDLWRPQRYGYLGLRLSDDAVLKTSARSTSTHGFIAQNASVTYSISPAELRVTVGGALIKQEPMIDYRGPAL